LKEAVVVTSIVSSTQAETAGKEWSSFTLGRCAGLLGQALLLFLGFAFVTRSFHHVEAQDARYYVSVRVEPFIPTDLGDRVVEPATIYVDAPGAKRVKVYLQPVDQPYGGKPIGKRKLIGIDDDPSDGFAVAWAADEPFDYVEIFAVAYGQPDVSRSRVSNRITILLDRRHLPNGSNGKVRSLGTGGSGLALRVNVE